MDDDNARIGRISFLLRCLGIYAFASLCVLPFAITKPSPNWGVLLFVGFVLMSVASGSCALEGEKRLHDMGRPGGLAWLLLIPAVPLVELVILSVVPGQPDENSFGPAPGKDR